MNVALVMERIEPWRGGAETSTMQFARHLAELDCRVTILTSSDAQSMPGLTVVPIRVTAALRALRSSQFAHRASSYVRQSPFDIVHAITPCLAADVYQPRGGMLPETLERNLALRSPTARGFKRLSQNLSLKYRAMGRLERDLLQRQPPPIVIAISQYVADQLARHYHFPSEQVRLVFNGVDPDVAPLAIRVEHRRDVRRQLGLADNDVVALCVAHNFKLKGVARLIEAMGLIRRRQGLETSQDDRRTDLYVVVVGRDNLTPYARLSQKCGVSDRVVFAGPTRRMDAFFHAADFLVHPTYYDPCSRVVLEGMAAGLPEITTRFNGAAEKITQGVDGFVVESPGDVPALADAMIALCDPERRRMMGPRALAAVAPLTMARHAQQVRSVYEEILRHRGTP